MSETGRRRPWLVALIAFFLPSAAMAYLNRGWWAVAYFVGILVIGAIGFVLLPTTTSTSFADTFVQYAAASLNLVGVVHAFILARKKEAERAPKWYSRRWYLIAASYYGFFAILLLVRAFLYQTFNVPSEGMSPTVSRGDFFIASKVAYKNDAPVRGDIVLFRPSPFPQTIYFKRVIGLPGEKIQIKGGVVFVNGQAVQQSAVRCSSYPCEAGRYRENLSSGLDYGVIILNRPSDPENTRVFSVPPESYFVLGDNRDNSDDSRFDNVGYVSREQIIGRAAFKYIADGHWTWLSIN
jgi:signal peptidase I